MSEPLYSSKDRDEAHRYLAEVIAKGEHPDAECREDPNDVHPYRVWSGPPPREEGPTRKGELIEERDALREQVKALRGEVTELKKAILALEAKKKAPK